MPDANDDRGNVVDIYMRMDRKDQARTDLMKLEQRRIEASPDSDEIVEIWSFFMRHRDPEIRWDAYSRLESAADRGLVPRWLPDLFWQAYFDDGNAPTALD